MQNDRKKIPAITRYRHILTFCTTITILILSNSTGIAQLSPGPLSKAHEHLEGLKKCSSCHKLGNREVGPKCLDCHTEIKEMQSSQTGLHSGNEYRDCITCHTEHLGSDFNLIDWPDGQANFQHKVIGYEMSGAHLELECRQCHNVKNVVDPGALRARNKDFDRTWLGLNQDCLSCHKDPHAGSLTQNDRTCLSCHDTMNWQAAPKFDHDSAAFPLTGEHIKVECLECHTEVEKPVRVGEIKVAVARFKPQNAESCASCHTDPHANALGSRCTDCHTTKGWLQLSGDRFDHAKTRYPLTGKHLAVGCADCHGGGRRKPDFASCTNCHQDSHDGVLLQKNQLLDCESCHDVKGFRPAQYTIEQHAELPFPLRGAHQATACFECHQPLAGTDRQASQRTANLAPKHNSCTECHTDAHAGETVALQLDCLACHQEESWQQPQYDHSNTGFALSGAHESAQCVGCHQVDKNSNIRFSTTSPDCASCHNDVHGGALVGKSDHLGQDVNCATCHVAVDWLAEKFDHEVHSRFSLRNGHEGVACRACHLAASDSSGSVPAYKPLPTNCLDCHSNGSLQQKEES